VQPTLSLTNTVEEELKRECCLTGAWLAINQVQVVGRKTTTQNIIQACNPGARSWNVLSCFVSVSSYHRQFLILVVLSAGDSPQRLNSVHHFLTRHRTGHDRRHELVITTVEVVSVVQLAVVDVGSEIRDVDRNLARQFYPAIVRAFTHRLLNFVRGPSKHPLC